MTAIELAQPRVIVIADRGRSYSLTISRISKAAWLRYFEGVVSSSEHQNGEIVESFDASAARVELVKRHLVDAEGYETGGAPIAEIEKWQEKITLRHLITVGNVLTAVGPSSREDDAPLALGTETVLLDATWGADTEGRVRQFSGLMHRFGTPTGEHQRRYARDSSRSRVIGGSRSGKTLYVGAQSTLVALYDELIESVEGYAVNGAALTSREQIVAEMDTFHKVAAASQLFIPAAPQLGEQ